MFLNPCHPDDPALNLQFLMFLLLYLAMNVPRGSGPAAPILGQCPYQTTQKMFPQGALLTTHSFDKCFIRQPFIPCSGTHCKRSGPAAPKRGQCPYQTSLGKNCSRDSENVLSLQGVAGVSESIFKGSRMHNDTLSEMFHFY